MTEQTTIRPSEAGQDQGKERCRWGRKTDNACWREAKAPRHDDWASGPWVCAEHKRALELAEDVDEYLDGLQKLQAWIEGAGIGPEVETPLMVSTYHQREELERRYHEARVMALAARWMADQREGETPLSVEDARKRAESFIREGALVNAATTLQDLPAAVLPPSLDRFAVSAALMAIHADGGYER